MRAPEFPSSAVWINAVKPLRLADLKGQVVLLDFWTYCCINCIHVMPDLKYLEHKFAGRPVVVIGVHSAKFENEQEVGNIESAVARYEIEHPVLVDNEHIVWNAYGVRAWPTFVLIDAEGVIRAQGSGEGLRDALEKQIGDLLAEGEKKGFLGSPLPTAAPRRAPAGTLSFPGKIAIDPGGKRLAIADSNHNRILLCVLETPEHAKIVEAIGTGSVGAADGGFSAAQFNHPQGLCFAGEKLYVCDTENHLLREVDLAEKTVTTLAAGATLNSPWDVAWRDGELYVAMAGSHQIWRLDLASGRIEPWAGNGRENIVDGDRRNAELAQPSGLSLFGDELYFADSEVSALRVCHLKSGEVETLVGTGLFDFGFRDGAFDAALLQHCLGVCAADGKVYVADAYNHAVREADLAARTVKTLVGRMKDKKVCMIGDAACELLPLSEPNDVELVGRKLYIADTNNHLIRVLDLPTMALKDVKVE
ncbi:redoxin domain-containing protein [Candidatus Uhrbacteria bacterium]|nr:redoxin domain-containing protein [Candidatus Uhrbacteria bacterium]